MSVADWKDKVQPTMEEVRRARAIGPDEGFVAALCRTASAAVFTLKDEGIDLEVTKGQLTNMQYMDALWPAALALTDQVAGSRAHVAAELLGLCCTLFRHWDEQAASSSRAEVDMKGYALCSAIGYRAGLLTIDETGLFEVANTALAAKKGRGDAIRERNLAKTGWHTDAQAKARVIRQTFPRRSASQVAEAIHNDPTIASPSYQQAYDLVLAWEKDGTIPRKKRAGEI